jgi:hypothetical protein
MFPKGRGGKFWNIVDTARGSGQRSHNDSLRAGRFRESNPGRARFSTPIQTSSRAHPAFYTMGKGSFPGVKPPGRGVKHPPTYSAKVKERVELQLHIPSLPSWQVVG